MRTATRPHVTNEDFDPTENQQAALSVLGKYYQSSPGQIGGETGLEKQRVYDALQSLIDAGWVEKESRGLYRLVYNGECYVTNEVKCIDDE